MSCGNCDSDQVSQTCGNPCGVSSVNTATCENIASQIENFTTHFFGEVTKTEVDGVVSWTLPCNLDVGLENNPRMDGEGLACYFLRLFNDGIIGATGPQGDDGADGAAGRNAYTVTLTGFTQPTTGAPNIQVSTSYNPCILVGMYVFIATSGWYLVTATDVTGELWLTLASAASGAPGYIAAGQLVVPAGYPGQSIQGPQGIQGPIGPQGTPGVSYTASNEFYYAIAGTDYRIQVLYEAVNFVVNSPTVTLSDAGTYIFTAVVAIEADPLILTTEKIFCKLRDTTAGVDLPGSVQVVRGLVPDSMVQIVINCRYLVPANGTTVALYAKMDSANKAFINPLSTTITAFRLE